MKATGIVRKLDTLGRIVLPIELRRNLDIKIKDSMEIFVEDEYVILQKYKPCCVFCKSDQNVKEFKGRHICHDCIKNLNELTKILVP